MKRLILFDIDGTILSTSGAAKKAFQRALLAVYGRTGPIDGHDFGGKTDPQIARELLRASGLTDADIDRRFDDLWSVYLQGLADELAPPRNPTRLLPGVTALLGALEARREEALLGILTGNVEAGARLKLSAVGLNDRFRLGAYGSDRERRDELPAVAIARARSLVGREYRGTDVVVIGDTPRDVACCRAAGGLAVAVATGHHGVDALAAAGADVVWPDLSDTGAVLASLLDRQPAG